MVLLIAAGNGPCTTPTATAAPAASRFSTTVTWSKATLILNLTFSATIEFVTSWALSDCLGPPSNSNEFLLRQLGFLLSRAVIYSWDLGGLLLGPREGHAAALMTCLVLNLYCNWYYVSCRLHKCRTESCHAVLRGNMNTSPGTTRWVLERFHCLVVLLFLVAVWPSGTGQKIDQMWNCCLFICRVTLQNCQLE